LLSLGSYAKFYHERTTEKEKSIRDHQQSKPLKAISIFLADDFFKGRETGTAEIK